MPSKRGYLAFVPYWSSLRSLGQYIVLEFDNRHDSLISRKPEVHVMTEKGRALWVLAFLSPIIAELLSGSSPPLEFFNPISFALLLGLYGAGVLVVRELAVMWRLGWMGIIVLGAAYGILEEGVAIKSFFDPFWMDLGGLGEYGRYVGTNWVWAVWLTIYHSMISITLPILITWLLYPNLRNTRLTNFSSFGALLVILLLDVVVCTLLLPIVKEDCQNTVCRTHTTQVAVFPPQQFNALNDDGAGKQLLFQHGLAKDFEEFGLPRFGIPRASAARVFRSAR